MIENQLKENNRIFGLDVLRAKAILLVLFSHFLWIYPKTPAFLAKIMELFGFLGVEIFFVLSGFLIGNILFKLVVQEQFSLKTVIWFLRRRWFRTFPNYFLALSLNIIISIWIGYQIESLWNYFFFLQNFSAPMPSFFLESWSLPVEEFAYLLLPFSFLIFISILKIKNKSTLYFISILILIVASLLAKYHYYLTTTNTTLIQWNNSLKAVVIYRLDSIFIGVLFSWLYGTFFNFFKKWRYVFFGLGIFGLLLMFVGVGFFRFFIDQHPFFWNVLYLPLTSLCFVMFLPVLSQWKNEPKFFGKPITFISKISYSIYLLHYSIVLQTLKYIFDTTKYNALQLHLFTFCYIVLTFILSWLLYRFFEKPIMDKR